MEDFLVSEVARENELAAHEILIQIGLPPIGSGVRMAHLKRGENDAFDWPLADVAVNLDLAPDGRVRSASSLALRRRRHTGPLRQKRH